MQHLRHVLLLSMLFSASIFADEQAEASAPRDFSFMAPIPEELDPAIAQYFTFEKSLEDKNFKKTYDSLDPAMKEELKQFVVEFAYIATQAWNSFRVLLKEKHPELYEVLKPWSIDVGYRYGSEASAK